MTYQNKLTLTDIARILSMNPITVRRIAIKQKKLSKHDTNTFDSTFPATEKVGRSLYVNEDLFYKWLSIKAGEKITPDDELMTTKDMKDYYSRSSTWLWQQEKAGNVPKHFSINRTSFWIKRKVAGEVSV